MNVLGHGANARTAFEKGLGRCGPTVHNNLFTRQQSSVYNYGTCWELSETDQFSRGNFWNDSLGRPTIVEALEVNEEQATGKLHLHNC